MLKPVVRTRPQREQTERTTESDSKIIKVIYLQFRNIYVQPRIRKPVNVGDGLVP